MIAWDLLGSSLMLPPVVLRLQSTLNPTLVAIWTFLVPRNFLDFYQASWFYVDFLFSLRGPLQDLPYGVPRAPIGGGHRGYQVCTSPVRSLSSPPVLLSPGWLGRLRLARLRVWLASLRLCFAFGLISAGLRLRLDLA